MIGARWSQGRNDPETPSGVPEMFGPRIDAEALWISSRGRSYGRRSHVLVLFSSVRATVLFRSPRCPAFSLIPSTTFNQTGMTTGCEVPRYKNLKPPKTNQIKYYPLTIRSAEIPVNCVRVHHPELSQSPVSTRGRSFQQSLFSLKET